MSANSVQVRTRSVAIALLVSAGTMLGSSGGASALTASASIPPGDLTAAQMGFSLYPPMPNGFDPTQASAADLAKYGFPARPASGSPQEATWLAAMAHAKVEVTPTFHTTPGHRLAPASIGGSQAQYSTQYAGNEASGPRGTAALFQGIEADWLVPQVTKTKVDSFSYAWIGLYPSAAGTQELLQEGTSQSWEKGVAKYSVFVERCCADDGNPVTMSLVIKPTDHMSFVTTLSGPNTVTFWGEDWATNKFYTLRESFSGSAWTSGDADVILERVQFCSPTTCTPQPLANFGQINFSAVNAMTNNIWQCLGSYFHFDPYLFQDTSWTVQLAAPLKWTDTNGCAFPIIRTNPQP